MDYLPADAIILIDSPGRCGERGDELLGQLTSDCKLLSASGLPVMTATDYALPWAELCRRLNAFGVILGDAFAAGRYALPPKSLLNCDARQLPSYAGSVETAAEDVQHYLSLRYRVVLLSSDKHRMEVLAGMFAQRGVNCLRGEYDIERMANTLLGEYHEGKLGRLSLEMPDE